MQHIGTIPRLSYSWSEGFIASHDHMMALRSRNEHTTKQFLLYQIQPIRHKVLFEKKQLPPVWSVPHELQGVMTIF